MVNGVGAGGMEGGGGGGRRWGRGGVGGCCLDSVRDNGPRHSTPASTAVAATMR